MGGQGAALLQSTKRFGRRGNDGHAVHPACWLQAAAEPQDDGRTAVGLLALGLAVGGARRNGCRN